MNKKLRDRVLIIATIITVICVLLGSVINTKNIANYFGGLAFLSKSVAIEDVLDGDISQISVALDMAGVTIKRGNENTISFTTNKSTTPIVDVKDGVLTVSAESNIKLTPFGNNASNLEITLKDDVEVIDIQLDMGSVELEDITSNSFSCTVDMGDIEINDCSISDLNVEADLGDIEIEKVDFINGTFNGAMGDVEITLPFDINEYSFDLSVGMGDVSVNDNQTGNTYQTTGGKRTVKVSLDMGDLEIK